MRTFAIVAVLAAVLAVASAQTAPGLTNALQPQLDAFSAAFAKKDAAAAAAYFTEDAVFLVSDQAAFIGRDQVTSALQALIDEGTDSLSLTIQTDLVVSSSPQTAHSVCVYVKHLTSSPMDTGHSSIVWSSASGSWLVSAISSVSNVTQSSAAVKPSSAVFMPSSSAARVQVQNFFNTFQGMFNSNSFTGLSNMLTSDVAVFTKHEPEFSGMAQVAYFLTSGLYSKGYSLMSNVVVEAGPAAGDLYTYARGVMTFYDINGLPVSQNNFLCLFASLPSPLKLKSFSVTPAANF